MSSLINQAEARKMTAFFRKEKNNVLNPHFQGIIPQAEKFDAAQFKAILEQPDCVAVRIYHGMADDHKIHTIIVGVDSQDNDLLTTDTIIENGTMCPPTCPTGNSLNS